MANAKGSQVFSLKLAAYTWRACAQAEGKGKESGNNPASRSAIRARSVYISA